MVGHPVGAGKEVIKVEERKEIEVTEAVEIKKLKTGNHSTIKLPGYEMCSFISKDKSGT